MMCAKTRHDVARAPLALRALCRLRQLNFRDDEVLIAHDSTVIESDDHVILFVIDKKYIRDVERLFQVGLTFF